MKDRSPDSPARRLVLVTGPSGAGRSSAIHVLEDLGYETIDNMPLRLIRPLLEDPATDRPLALGMDPRNRHFSITAVTDALGQIAGVPGLVPELLYLDCATDVLLQRFSETRRRHPLAEEDRVEAGIQRELQLLTPLKARADVLIDTTALNVHQLRAEVEHWFATEAATTLAVSIQSFSYKRGLPRSVDMVFDCRFLKNPYWEPALRSLTGQDAAVRDHIATDPLAQAFEESCCCSCCPHIGKRESRTFPSPLGVPGGNIGRLPWRKPCRQPLQRLAGRCQLGIVNWIATSETRVPGDWYSDCGTWGSGGRISCCDRTCGGQAARHESHCDRSQP